MNNIGSDHIRSFAANPGRSAIGGFEIVREIGRGGMGIVYEAMELNPKRPVALKVIRGARYVDDHELRMFQREIAALARLAPTLSRSIPE